MGKNQGGFTLIELLIVVAIIGLLAAVAVPAMVSALDSGKQKATLGDLRMIGQALDRYYIDHGRYPLATAWEAVDTALRPHYLAAIPRQDGWGNPLLFDCTETSCAVQAPCKEGAPDTLPTIPFETDPADLARDIVWQDGGFLQRPSTTREEDQG